MARLEIRLLGPMTVAVDGQRVDAFEADAARALLAYLALEADRPTPREVLAGLLWPESPASEALRNLRTALYRLRRALGDRDATRPLIEATRQSLQLALSRDIWVDARAFTDLTDACRDHEHLDASICPECVGRLAEAVELYCGDLLEGLYLPSPAFEAWRQTWSQSLAGTLSWALAALVAHCTSQGDLDRGIGYARRSLSVDPLDEPTHRRLMSLYARSDRRADAVRQYETCRRVLEAELCVAPSTQTEDLYQRLLDDALPATETVDAAVGREVRRVGPCPYRGLAAFRESDAEVFFGREAFVAALAQAVATPPHLTTVVGPSGSGKSSVVAAGVLPQLRASGDWHIVTLRPGRQPWRSLAGALIPLLEPDLSATARIVERRRLAEALRNGNAALEDILVVIAESRPGKPILLSIDQFEETYTLCADTGARSAFVDALVAVAGAGSGGRYGRAPASVLLTLRADFVGQALAHRAFAEALQAGIQLLGPMSRDELRATIEKPAASQGAVFEAGLVERLLDDVAGAPGNLPLLEFALTLLWERLDHGWLTHAAYEAIGRVQGALAQYAQEEFDALTPEDQALARRIFVQLVQPGEDTEDTRRVATRTDLSGPPAPADAAGSSGPEEPTEPLAEENAWGLVQHLADRRLVVTGRDAATGAETVEVVHEALIQHWEQIQTWMAEDRAFRTWQERLRVSVGTWLDTDRDEGVLLRGVPLGEAEGWLADRRDGLGPTEAAFVEASIDLRERRAAEREAQLQREREAARQLAEAHEQALRQAAIGLAAEAKSLMQTPHQDVAVLLALEAVERFPYTWQAEQALAHVVLNWRLMMQFAHEVPIYSRPEISPDGSRFLTADERGTLRTWDVASGALLLSVQAYTGTDAEHHWAYWSPSADRILTCTLRGGIPRVWDAGTGELLAQYPTTRGDAGGEWSPDGAHIVSRSDRLATVVWDAGTGDAVHVLPAKQEVLAEYSPNGRRLATSDGRIWSAKTGEELQSLEGYGDVVAGSGSPPMGGLADSDAFTPITWSPDGTRIGASKGDTAYVWDARTGQVALVLPTDYGARAKLWWSPSGDQILALAWDIVAPAIVWDGATGATLQRLPCSTPVNWGLYPWAPDGDLILLPYRNGKIELWDADAGRLLLSMAADSGWCEANWLPDGSGFITTGADGNARLWRTSTAASVVNRYRNQAPMISAGYAVCPVWSPDSFQVARSYADATVVIWSTVTGEELLRFTRPGTPAVVLRRLAWSPDGRRIVTGSRNGAVDIWDSRTGKRLLALAGHDDNVRAVAWSPDSQCVLSCGSDQRAVVWDSSTGAALTVMEEPAPTSCTWSPDGTRIVITNLLSYSGHAMVWDAASGQALLTLLSDDFAYGTTGVAWSPDGSRIAAFSTDGMGRLWNTATGEEEKSFPVGQATYIAEWSPSGKRLLVGSAAGIHIWDATTLEQVARYPAEGPTGASWSPDGTAIAICYANGDLRIYPAWESLEDLIAYAKEHCVLRELTPEERAQYGLAERD